METASKLRDYAFATTDQTAQQQKQLLENEIAYENLKTATLIGHSQRAIDHENKKRKADIADELKLESARHKLKLSNCSSKNWIL